MGEVDRHAGGAPDDLPAALSRARCLDEEEARALLAGELSAVSQSAAHRHLVSCVDCKALVARLTPRPYTSATTEIGKPLDRSPMTQSFAGGARERAGAADREPAPPVAPNWSSPHATGEQHGQEEHDQEEQQRTSAPAAPSLRPGTILRDTYRILRHLEKGGMGEVYEASHARLSGRYAVKVLPLEFAANKTMLARFRREAQIASSLQHSNIVQVIDFHETDEGRPYLVMEYLDGENLARFLARRGPLPPAEALPIIRQIAAALAAVHGRGVTHRDIKPQNVFVIPQQDGSNLVKLLDFGISKGNVVASVVTRQPALMGTPQYMAPEQALRRMEEVGPATDQFALAAVAYEMLTGRPPFEGPLVSVVLYHIVHEPPPSVGPDPTLRRIEPVLLRALSKKISDRYPAMADFTAALTAAAAAANSSAVGVTPEQPAAGADSSVPVVVAAAAAARPRPTPKLVAVLVTLAAAASTLMIYRWSAAPARRTVETMGVGKIGPAGTIQTESGGGRPVSASPPPQAVGPLRLAPSESAPTGRRAAAPLISKSSTSANRADLSARRTTSPRTTPDAPPLARPSLSAQPIAPLASPSPSLAPPAHAERSERTAPPVVAPTVVAPAAVSPTESAHGAPSPTPPAAATPPPRQQPARLVEEL